MRNVEFVVEVGRQRLLQNGHKLSIAHLFIVKSFISNVVVIKKFLIHFKLIYLERSFEQGFGIEVAHFLLVDLMQSVAIYLHIYESIVCSCKLVNSTSR